jgi:hypothetical protein
MILDMSINVKITKRQLRNLIRESILREADDSDDVNYAYNLWSKNQQKRGPEKPRPENAPSESPAVIEVKDKVLSFLEGAGLGEPKQMGIQHRWTVEPHPGVEFDFHVQAMKDKPRLVIKLSAIRDFLPGNANVYAEDVGLVAENLVKISQILKALDDSGLPIHMISFSTRT